MDDVWLDSGIKIPVGRWVYDPCWRCGRQPDKAEIVKLDWLAHTVLCWCLRQGRPAPAGPSPRRGVEEVVGRAARAGRR